MRELVGLCGAQLCHYKVMHPLEEVWSWLGIAVSTGAPVLFLGHSEVRVTELKTYRG